MWHLTSSNGTFQVLLFYHKLSGDILKNLKNSNFPYEPLIDDSVRVNIAPLQKVGLLKHPVLVAKDVDRAIADRNRWREDDKEQEGPCTP